MEHIDKSEDSTKEIIIMVTNQCNLSCRYCYESMKNTSSVNLLRIKEALKLELEQDKDNYTNFIITFHGGEPFLSFDKIKQLTEWAWETFVNFKIIFTATTNGTVLTKEIKDWLSKHKKRFIPILSLDGDKETHNLNRGNSYDKIDRDFFKSNWPKQWVKMTVSPNTLYKMYENVCILQDQGFYANPTLAREVDWNTERDIPILAKELKKLCEYYLSHPDVHPGQLLDIPLHKFSPYFANKNINSCGAGFNITAYDVDANKYPCQTFISDLSNRYDEEEYKSILEKLHTNNGLNISPKCEGCKLIVWCSPCYGINYSNRGDMGAFDELMCQFNKVILLSAASMYAQMLPQRSKYGCLDSKTEKEIYHMAAGIKYIFSFINI